MDAWELERLSYRYCKISTKLRLLKVSYILVAMQESRSLVVSDQVLHKPACTVSEEGQKFEISDLRRTGIVQFM